MGQEGLRTPGWGYEDPFVWVLVISVIYDGAFSNVVIILCDILVKSPIQCIGLL